MNKAQAKGLAKAEIGKWLSLCWAFKWGKPIKTT